MNFLSHLYLAGDSVDHIIGNYIADSVKGKAFELYSPSVQEGIVMHRKIDTFTDTHPVVEESKKRLREKYRKYSSVIVDIYYDHYLAVNFQQYSAVDLRTFVGNVYGVIQNNHSVLPEKSVRFTEYMLKNDILFAYSKLEGIEKVLKGMAYRASFESKMEKSIDDLKEHYPLFEKEFAQFFPELESYVKGLIKNGI